MKPNTLEEQTAPEKDTIDMIHLERETYSATRCRAKDLVPPADCFQAYPSSTQSHTIMAEDLSSSQVEASVATDAIDAPLSTLIIEFAVTGMEGEHIDERLEELR